jgi:hypothetical protein
MLPFNSFVLLYQGGVFMKYEEGRWNALASLQSRFESQPLMPILSSSGHALKILATSWLFYAALKVRHLAVATTTKYNRSLP